MPPSLSDPFIHVYIGAILALIVVIAIEIRRRWL